MTAPLVCPGCGTGGALDERFCPRCGSPLVYSAGMGGRPSPREDEATARARKVHPPYAEGEPVRVATAQNQPEAEMVQGLLLEAGVPSLVRRSGGFDVPDFLAAGPRDILVPRGGEQAARDVLGTRSPVAGPRTPARPWVRALAVALAVLVIALVAAGVVAAVVSGAGGARGPGHVPQNVRYAPKLGGAGAAYGSRPGRSSNGWASTSSSRRNGRRSPALAAASASSTRWLRGM